MYTAIPVSTNGWTAHIRGRKPLWKDREMKKARKVGLRKAVGVGMGTGKAVLVGMLLLGDECWVGPVVCGE
jgi:hypothetical protein